MPTGTIIGDAVRYATNVWKYRDGTSGPRNFDQGAILPVADLSPLARLGAALGNNQGWHWHVVQNVHGGAGTLNASTDLWTVLAALELFTGLNPDQHAIWILDSYVTCTSLATLTSVGHGVLVPVGVMGAPSPPANGTIRYLFNGTAAAAPPFTLNDGGGPQPGLPNVMLDRELPFPVPRGALLRSGSLATGVVTVNHMYQLWIGPRGVLPPGKS